MRMSDSPDAPARLLTVEQALDRVLRAIPVLEPEHLPLGEVLGHVLAEDITADLDMPPFDNTSMDGYAVRAADTRGASPETPVPLRVLASVPAGQVPDCAVEPGTAIRIMTGAPLPSDADAVVQFELTDELQTRRPAQPGGTVQVLATVQPGQNVRPRGEDVRAGSIVLATGTPVRPPEIGILAMLGHTHVWVYRRPRVAILSTGDELVEIHEQPGPGQIRDSNRHALAAQVARYGGIPIQLGIARDTVEDLRAKLRGGAAADLLVTSAGVSVGDLDIVKAVLQMEGELAFWQVRMRPGKPLAFGHLDGVPLLGLPGNPVSSLVSFEQFVRPAILKMQGHTRLGKPELWATCLDAIDNRGGRRSYLRGIIERDTQVPDMNCYIVRLAGPQGSNILTSLAKANGLIIVPETQEVVQPGDRVRVQMLDWPEI
jgi:molybdopterin molybdotransferase